MKRTTLILEESCMDQIRKLANEQDRTISEVVNDLLVEGLQKRKKKASPRFKLRTYSMGKPRVNLGDRDALEDLMDS
jgi:hypothetical protein